MVATQRGQTRHFEAKYFWSIFRELGKNDGPTDLDVMWLFAPTILANCSKATYISDVEAQNGHSGVFSVFIGVTKCMQVSKSGVIFVAVSLALSLFGAEAASGHAKRRAGFLVFRGALTLKVLFIASSSLFVTISIGMIFEGLKEIIDYVALSFLLLLIVAAFHYWPADITISQERISATKWFGLWKKEIDWVDVEYACEYPDENCVKVVSKSGVTIEHTRFHVDRQYFKREVGQHCWLPGSSPA